MGLPYDDIDKNETTTTYNVGDPKFILDSLSASPFNSANKFSFHLTKGSLKFVNLHAKLSGSFPLDKFLVPNTWKTKFLIENETSIVLKRPILLTRLDDDRQFIPDILENLEYEIEFEHTTVTPATSSTFLTSYADVTFGNLRTFSGDVNKVKLFGRQKDQQNAEFKKFGEFVLETKNELRDSTSVTGNDPIGIFYSQSIVDNFWQSSSASPILTDNSRIMNAVLVKGSNENAGTFVEFKTKNQFELEKNEEYIVSFQSYYIKKNKVLADGSERKTAEIEVFLSGSATSQTGEVLSLGSVSDFGDNASELLRGNVSGSIPRLYNYFTTHKKSGAKPKVGLVFRVNAGEFYISNVKLEPVSDRNFNPGFYKTIVPMPVAARRGQRYDFAAEFYDSDNNKADIEATTSASVLFAGAKQVLADGEDAVLTGSVLIGESLEMYGVNPAYLRSVGYSGFDKTIAGTGDRNGGFMLFSGSVGTAIGSSETYDGVGLEIVDASSTNKHEHAFLQFASNYKGTGNSRFRVQTSEFLLGVSGSGAAETFISGSQGKLRISSSNFHLDDDGAVTMQGTITATAGGTIGGFTIGSDNLTATNFVLNTTDKSITLGSGDNVFIADADDGIQLGDATFADAPFSVTPAGLLKATSGTIGGFTITTNQIKSSDGNITLNKDSKALLISDSTFGNTGIQLQHNSGTPRAHIGKGNGEGFKFDGTNIIMSSSKFMLGSKGSANSYISSSGNLLEISSSNFRLSSSGDVSVEGTITATAGTIGGFSIGSSTLTGTNFTLDTSNKRITLGSGDDVFIADADTGLQLGDSTFADAPFSVTEEGVLKAQSGTIGGFTLSTNALTATNFSLDPSNKRITLGTGTNIFIADGDEGIQLGNGTFANAPFSVTKAGVLKAEQGFIGGFAITSGSIETTDFASGLKGLRLSTAANGTIEAENAKIRGTLATTVFEKETVNAVGGQLLIANSTALTSSAFHSLPVSASQTTMSVVNVTGFAANEILLIKKVGDTGFSTEYVKVVSSSRDFPSSDKNFSGRLFVNRAINSGSMSSAGMFMESGSSAQTYENGQVLVSTGKEDTGFIKLNANPNDVFTPYIDIVERTGSAVYDIDLKARLGDLSGLSSALVGSTPGFGLFSENVFLTGKITATSGEIGGITIESDKIYSGTGTHGNSNTPFFVQGGSAATAGDFSLGDKLVWDASAGTLNIDGTLSIGSLPDGTISSSAQIASDISGSSSGAISSLNTRTGSLDTLETRVVIHNGGMYLRNQSGATLTSIGTSIALGTSGSNEENILIDSDGVDIRSGTTSLADFGSTVRIGKSGQARTEITDTAISMYDGQATPRKRVAINNAGVIAIGGASGADVSVSSTDEVVRIDSTGVNIFNDSNNFTFVSGSGMSVFSGGNKVAQFASEVKIGDFEDDTKSFVKIDNDSLDIMAGSVVTASFGATTTLGNTSNEHIQISGSGIELKDGSTQKFAIQNSGVSIGTPGQARTEITDTEISMFSGQSTPRKRVEISADGLVALGGATDADVSVSSTDDVIRLEPNSGITIFSDSNNKSVIDANGLTVTQGGNQVAQFAATTIVGEVGASKSNVQITSGAINLRNNTTNKLTLAANGSISIGSNFSVTSGGSLTLEGNITATAGNIGGWNIDGTTLKSDDNSIVLDEGNDLIKVVGTAAGIGGASLATSAELFNDGSVSGSSFRILKDGMDGSTDVPIIKINSSQQYMTGDIDNDYTTNVDKKSISFTSTGNSDDEVTTTFPTGTTTWPDNGIIGYMGAKGTGATNGLITQMADNTGSFNLLDTQADNNVVEIQFQNLRESVKLGGTTGNDKSRYQWKAEIYQSDTNSASPSDIELVGSFKISSLLFDNATNVAVTTPDLFVLNKRFFFVSWKGWGYDELTDTNDNKVFELNFGGTPISATQYLPKTRMTALGLQSYAGPNQNALFGAKNEILGDYIIRKTGTSPNKRRGNLLVEGKSSVGTLEIDDTFTFYTEGEIGASGNITAFYSSDERLKENIIEIKDGLSIVNQLRPVKFDWKEDSPFAHLKPTEYGLIAQEVEEVIPEVVGNMKQDYKGVKYEGLVPLLIQSIKDLTKRIEQLEKKVN